MALPPIPSELIKKTAGETRFQSGLAAAREVSVKQLDLKEREATGIIDHHHVRIQVQGEQLSGACDCEDSDGFDFCEHCVVLALHANRQSQQRLTLAKGPDRSKVLAYLLSLDKSVLAKQMLAILDEDAQLFRQYVLKAALENQQIDYADLRRQVTALTRPEERLFSQRQVKHFFARIEQFLQELEQATPDAPERMLKVMDYLLQRLNQVLDKTDDRAGIRLPSAKLLSDIHLRLFSQIDGRSPTRMKRFLQSWRLDRHTLLQHTAAEYLDAKGLELFVAALYKEWDVSTDDLAREHIARSLYRLQAIDLCKPTGLAMRCLLARDAGDWLDIANALVHEGDNAQAIAILEEARSLYPEYEAVSMTLARLYLSDGKKAHTLLTQLCAAQPELICPLVFPELNNTADAQAATSLSALQQGCFESLLKSASLVAKRWCRDIYLHLGKGESAWQLLQHEDNPEAEALLRCAKLLQYQKHDLALKIVSRTFELLLSKERYSTDRQLAELIEDFPIACDEADQQNLLQQFRTRILRRPAIIEALRQNARNLQLGEL